MIQTNQRLLANFITDLFKLSACNQYYKQFTIIIYNSKCIHTVNCFYYDTRVVNYDRSDLFNIDHFAYSSLAYST